MKGLASRVDADGEARRQGGRSTLSPVRDDWPGTPTSPDMSGQRGSGRGTVDVNEQSLRGLVLEGGVLGRGEARAGWSESPLEMTDRSRPW